MRSHYMMTRLQAGGTRSACGKFEAARLPVGKWSGLGSRYNRCEQCVMKLAMKDDD